MTLLAALLSTGGLLAPAVGQPPMLRPNPPADQPNPPTNPPPDQRDQAPGNQQVDFEKLPAPVKLGVRAEFIKQNTPIAPVVVLVEDAESYLKAMSAWRPGVRFPVLIDDGSSEAREDIARFFRAFAEQFDGAKLARFRTPDASPVPDAKPALRPAGWRNVTEAQLRGILFDSVNAPSGEFATRERIVNDSFKQLPSPGLVVTSVSDLAWPAALALACGRAQPLVFAEVPGDPTTVMARSDADALAQTIETAAEATGIPWKGLGDGLEAVTLCLNCPVKFGVTDSDQAALTDRIGRLGKGEAAANRWAWAGQIFGSPARTCYMAMCALFLSPRSAWAFDGYPDSVPWNTWDAGKAAKVLQDAGWKVDLDDTPRQSIRDWRSRAAGGTDAGLILVNSKGNSDFFELEPGQAKPADIPMLRRPAMVHFVHSWSAQWPARRDTVAGRWFERGVYAYTGSVKEPYLQAFLPTPAVAGRFTTAAPWGAAVRLDDAPMWKIAVFGDPLLTNGRSFKVLPDAAVLDPDKGVLKGAAVVGVDIAEKAKAARFLEVVIELTLLGKDEKVRDLVVALQREKPEQVTAEVATAAVLPMLRAGSVREAFSVAARIQGDLARSPFVVGPVRDALWLAIYPAMMQAPDMVVLRVLRDHLRPDNADRDATELGMAWARTETREGATMMLKSLKADLPDRIFPHTAIDGAVKAVEQMRGAR